MENIASFSKDATSTRTRGKPGASGDAKPTGGRLGQERIDVKDSPSCSVTVYNEDGRESGEGTGRSDDGSDDSVVPPKLAEAAVMKGIRSFRPIDTVIIKVALKKEKQAEVFHFSRVWTVPRLVLQLSSGRLALKNVSFLVAYNELSDEDLLIGLPFLHHLELDTRTLLEMNRAIPDGTDCSSVGNPAASSKAGSLGHLVIARLNQVNETVLETSVEATESSDSDDERNEATSNKRKLDPNRLRSDYYKNRREVDPFPDSDVVEILTDDERKVRDGEQINAMIQKAKYNGLPEEYWQRLEDMTHVTLDVFTTGFSA